MLNCFEKIKSINQKPIIHNITNYVTANDCANVIIASNGSPIMSDEILETNEITSTADSLNINIGTLNQNTLKAICSSCEIANKKKIPIILDPVGCGTSNFRLNSCLELFEKYKFSVIKMNYLEFNSLFYKRVNMKGIDSDLNVEYSNELLINIKEFSKLTNSIIVITGKIDIVCYKERICEIYNGSEMMHSICGTGCMLASLISVYLAINNDYFNATIAAICHMGIAGEIAFSKLESNDGNLSFKNHLIDAIYSLDYETFKNERKCEFK